MQQANGLRHTLSDAVNQSKPLVDAGECLFKARHVVCNGFFNVFVAAVDRVTAFIERIHALV